MPHVNTVTGEVSPDALGFTLPHEHLVTGMNGWQFDLVDALPREQQLKACEVEVKEILEAGVKTMGDATTPDMSRDIELVKEVSERTGMQIIAATGLYARRPLGYMMRRTAPELSEIFTTEIDKGIRGTVIKAGFIKAAVESPDLTEYEQAVLAGAAATNKDTGAAIMVHIEPGAGPAVAKFLTEHGVPGEKIVIAHAENDPNLYYLLDIIEKYDANVGFDRFGYEVTVRNDIRVATVAALCHLGKANRIHLSHDHVAVLHGRDVGRWDDVKDKVVDWRWTYVPTKVVPRLKENGVTEDQIEQMTIRNPAQFFALT